MRRLAILLAAILIILPAAAADKKKPAPTRRTPTAEKPESPGIARPFAAPDEDDPSVFPYIAAEAVVLCDAASGRVLYEKNADQIRAIASTQKLLTALIVAEDGGLNSEVCVAASDARCEPTKLGIKAGETYKRYDLLKILLVKSMNDVALCLARDNAGSISAFAAKMNAKAREIGMRRSNFVNPNGLTEEGQYSNARDLARLALHAYRNRILRSVMSTRTLAWKNAAGKTLTYENTNKLLKYFGACNGMKTGYTEAAGHCLVASAALGGKHVIAVVLGDNRREDIWNDSYRLMNWGLHHLRSAQ